MAPSSWPHGSYWSQGLPSAEDHKPNKPSFTHGSTTPDNKPINILHKQSQVLKNVHTTKSSKVEKIFSALIVLSTREESWRTRCPPLSGGWPGSLCPNSKLDSRSQRSQRFQTNSTTNLSPGIYLLRTGRADLQSKNQRRYRSGKRWSKSLAWPHGAAQEKWWLKLGCIVRVVPIFG